MCLHPEKLDELAQEGRQDYNDQADLQAIMDNITERQAMFLAFDTLMELNMREQLIFVRENNPDEWERVKEKFL